MINITFVKDFIEEIISKENIDRSRLLDDGAIYYMNGNDGTDFDYSCNGHACEFFVFWENEIGAVKVFVEKDRLNAYCYYDETDAYNHDKIHRYEKAHGESLLDICEHLQGTFDDKKIWDTAVTNWVLTESSSIYDESDDEEEY